MKVSEFNALLDTAACEFAFRPKEHRPLFGRVIELAIEIAAASPEDCQSLLPILDRRAKDVRGRKITTN